MTEKHWIVVAVRKNNKKDESRLLVDVEIPQQYILQELTSGQYVNGEELTASLNIGALRGLVEEVMAPSYDNQSDFLNVFEVCGVIPFGAEDSVSTFLNSMLQASTESSESQNIKPVDALVITQRFPSLRPLTEKYILGYSNFYDSLDYAQGLNCDMAAGDFMARYIIEEGYTWGYSDLGLYLDECTSALPGCVLWLKRAMIAGEVIEDIDNEEVDLEDIDFWEDVPTEWRMGVL